MASAVEKVEVYSVWGIPPEPARERLRGLMSALRSDFGGPRFDPHVTVVGSTALPPDEALRRFRSACCAAEAKPYTARVADVARGHFFYQCVYLLLDPIPEVVGASDHCCRHFDYKRSSPYMPHLSLLYGDLSDEEKEKARKKVEVLDKDILNLSFEIEELALYRTDTEDKTLESWEKVTSCKLKTGCDASDSC